MAATSSTAIVPQILDGEHDYKDWSVRVKTYLLSKDLWDVVETTSEPPEQEGDFKAWRKNNAEALHAIQLSCGPRTFPSIRDKTTAKAAWDTLEAQFNPEKSELLRSMAATSSTAIVPQILDGEHDYKDWSVRVKTYLLSKDLWDVVETTGEAPEQEGDFKAWRKDNAEALHAIQLSCGPRTFPSIRDKTTAKAAWDTLEALFNREESELLRMPTEINRVENPVDYEPFFAAVRRGDWYETKEFLTRHSDAITATDSWGETTLHKAARFGHKQIEEELVQLMTEEQLEIKDNNGWTALAYAAKDNIKMVECMVAKNKKLLGIAEQYRKTPILIAARNDRWDIVRYIYSTTPLEDLMPDKGPYGSELVSVCLHAKQFGNKITLSL